jgi:hypothetical protein
MLGVADDLRAAWLPAYEVCVCVCVCACVCVCVQESREESESRREPRQRRASVLRHPAAAPTACPTVCVCLRKPCWQVERFPEKYGHDTATAGPELTRRLRERFFQNDFPRFMRFIVTQLRASAAHGSRYIAGGGQLSIADCHLLPQLDYFRRAPGNFVPKDCLEPYPEVRDYLHRLRDETGWPYAAH